MDRTKKLHIAMFPWLAYGHIMPFLEVSKMLAQKGHQISFISTPKTIAQLPKHLSSNITFLQFPLPHAPGLPPEAETTAEIPIHKVPSLKKAYDKLELPLTQFLKTSHVNWIIHDFAPYWLPAAAAPLGIKLAFFSIFNATVLAFLGPPSALLSPDARKRPEDLTAVPEWIDYPCSVAPKLHEIRSHQECMDEVSDFHRLGTLIQGCHFMALRSCPEFEFHEIPLLGKLYGKPVLPLGLLPPPLPSEEDEDEKWEGIKKWLDGKEMKSVFYVAFGSEVGVSGECMEELAIGIERSRLPFVWVVRRQALDKMPEGFEERVGGRGLVLKEWAPQVRILAHPSVGGFLTHCGWSSIIEGLRLGRALILFSGGSSDQGFNARLMHGKKVGLEIERDEEDGSFRGEAVGETIRRVMVEAEGEAIRANAWAMKEIFGSEELSERYLDGFARFIEDFPPSPSPQIEQVVLVK